MVDKAYLSLLTRVTHGGRAIPAALRESLLTYFAVSMARCAERLLPRNCAKRGRESSSCVACPRMARKRHCQTPSKKTTFQVSLSVGEKICFGAYAL